MDSRNYRASLWIGKCPGFEFGSLRVWLRVGLRPEIALTCLHHPTFLATPHVIDVKNQLMEPARTLTIVGEHESRLST